MDVEQLAICDFLAKCPPLTDLSADVREEVATVLQVIRFRKGEEILTIGADNAFAYLIRAGAVDVLLENSDWYGRFGDSDWVGYRSVMRGGKVSMTVQAIEDTVLYAVPGALFLDLIARFERVQQYFAERKPERLRIALKEIRGNDGLALVAMHVRDLMKLPMLQWSYCVIAACTHPRGNRLNSRRHLIGHVAAACYGHRECAVHHPRP
jgi:Predicted signal-transduction protein containing cAMP-binding and CBS domains